MASEGTGQQQEAALVVPEEVTAVLEEIVTTVSSDNAGRPNDISVLHDYAMDHLFSFLPMSDLKNCRLVNRSWNRASNRAIQKKNYVLYIDDYSGCRGQKGHRIEDIPKLSQLIRTSFQFPWTKFKLHGQAYYGPAAKKEKTLQLLFGSLLCAISPIVTELEIHHLWNLPNLEYPKLRKLTLRYDSSNAAPTWGSNWTSLLEMVETASKLNELGIIGYLKTPLFMNILEIPNCRKITGLSLGWWIKEEHLVRISKMGLQLKVLNLDFQVDKVTAESVRAVLESQSNCLEYLKFTCKDDLKKLRLSSFDNREIESPLSDFGCQFALLKMKHLQVLELRGNFGQISDQVMERMREKFVVRLET